MKHSLICAVALTLALSAAHAQQPMTPEQQVAASLGQQIGLLSHQIALLQTQLQQAQQAVVAAQAEAKALKDKYEPKAPPAPPK